MCRTTLSVDWRRPVVRLRLQPDAQPARASRACRRTSATSIRNAWRIASSRPVSTATDVPQAAGRVARESLQGECRKPALPKVAYLSAWTVTMDRHLIIFTRYPEPHKTKTRLIPALGAEGAASSNER